MKKTGEIYDMNNEVKLTVVCTTYNHEKYIEDAIKGFLMQKTNFNYRILIHDDASTDGTSDIINRYKMENPNIVAIIQKDNLYSEGISRMPFIVDLLEGKYIAVCEGDDYWTDPYKLQKQVDFLDNHSDYSICATSTKQFNLINNKLTLSFYTKEDRDVTIDEIIREKNGIPYHYSSMVMRKNVYTDQPEWKKILRLGNLGCSLLGGLNGKIRMLHDVTSCYRYFTEGSWSERMRHNPQKQIGFQERRKKAFILYNEYSNYTFQDSIDYELARADYLIGLYSGEICKMLNKHNKCFYHSLSFKQRAKNIVLALKYRFSFEKE